jgi:hypothetical protein
MTMRRPYLGLAVVLSGFLVTSGNSAYAQLGFGLGGGDPFTLYFGYYLPHQAAQAMRPTPMDTINAATRARQITMSTDRSGLYDPVVPYGEEELDPLHPYGRRGRERLVQPHTYATSTTNQMMRGIGPRMYFNRASTYFPTAALYPGRGPNRNLAVTRTRGMNGGYGMMPAVPTAPGPR